MMRPTGAQILRIMLDGLSVFLVFLPWILLQTLAKPYRRGFFCDDESIKHPLLPNTVPSAPLTAVGIILTFIVFVVVEGVHFYRDAKRECSPHLATAGPLNFQWRLFVTALYALCGIFLFGLAVEQTITDIGKYTIGRLRPHFLSACEPNYSALNCTTAADSPGGAGLYQYVEIDDSQCTNHEEAVLKDSRMSFPSGHSSFSAYVAMFLVFYLQARWTWRRSRLVCHFLQVVLIYLAVFVCLSRISDYKHHPGDVFAGAAIGVFIASLTCAHIANQFKWLRLPSDSVSLSSVRNHHLSSTPDLQGVILQT